MRAPRTYTTEGIVIRRLDYGEADRILTIYTPGRGKIRVMAKGIRRSGSRRAGHLDLFTRATLMLAQGRSFDIITQAQAQEHYVGLRTNVMAAAYAHYTAELLDAFVPDHMINTQLYALQLATLRRLASTPSPLHVRAFEMTLLELAGYRPELHTCLGCGKNIKPEANGFSASLGGVLCADCAPHDRHIRRISVAALKLLRNLQTAPDRILRLESVDAGISREVESRMHEYIVYRLEKRLKSMDVLARIEATMAEHQLPNSMVQVPSSNGQEAAANSQRPGSEPA